MKTKSKLIKSAGFRKLLFSKPSKLVVSALGLGLLFSGVLLLGSSSPAHAAACTLPGTTFGTDTLPNPSSGTSLTVPATGTYNIWTRMMAPAASSDEIMLQVTDQTTGTVTCFNTVGGPSSNQLPTLNTWSWVDQNNSTSNLTQVTLNANDNIQLEYIGIETGVSVDRTILLSPTDPCAPPTGTGDSCTPAVTPPTISFAAPTAGSTVNGSSVAISVVLGNTDSNATVTYKVDGNTIAGNPSNISSTTWNSTSVTDGSHALSATVTDNGLSSTAQETVNVLNNVCTLAPTPPSGLTDTDTAPLPASKVDLSWSAGAPATNCQLAGYNIYRTDASGNTVKLNSSPVTGSSSSTISAVGALDSSDPGNGIATFTDNPQTKGDLMIYSVNGPHGDTISSLSGGGVSTWTKAAVQTASSSGSEQEIWYGIVTATGSSTITTNWSTALTSSHGAEYNVQEYSTSGTPSWSVDKTNQVSTTTSSTTVTYPSITPSGSGELYYGWAIVDNTASAGSSTGFNYAASAYGNMTTYNTNVSSPNNYQPTASQSPTGTYEALGVVFNPGTSNSGGLSYTDSTVAANTTYHYQVSSVETTGTNPESAKVPAAPGLSVTTGGNCSTVTGQPTAPGTPTINASGTTYTNVAMTWTASTDNDGCTFSGYHVYRVDSSGNKTLLGSPTTTSFTDTGSDLSVGYLASGTTYGYQITAYDSGGNTGTSATAQLSTLKDNVAPTIPTGLAGTATSNSVTLNWNASTDLPNPGAVGVAGYNIYVNDAASPANASLITATNWLDTNIVSTNSPYKFAVQAVDNNGNASAISADISVPIPAPTCSTAPAAPTLSATQNQYSVSLTWNVVTPPAGCTFQGYEVFRNSSPLTPLVTSGTSFTDNNLAPGTYSYTVETIDSNGPASIPSNSKSFTVTDTTPPTPPTVFTATALSSNQVQLAWSGATDNVGITSYVITRTSGSSTVTLPTIAGTASSYTDSSVSASTQYTYSIQAFDAAQNSSTVVTAPSVTTPAPSGQTPPVPTGLQSILITSNFIALSWNASSGATSYTVYRTGPNNQVQQFTTTTASYGDSGLTDNTTYNYAVTANNTAGSSAKSGSLGVQTLISPTTTLIGDINGDGKVNIFDLAILLSNWNKTNMTYQQGDLNGDGTVNIFDLGLMLSDWTG